MVKKKNKEAKHLKESEKESLHLSEFSQGKPFEFSLNVLENKSLAQTEKKPGRLKRLFTRDKDSAQGLPDTPYISDGSEPVGSSPSFTKDQGVSEAASVTSAGDALEGIKRTEAPGAFFLDDSSRQEIEKRQHKRRLSRIISGIVIALVVVVGVCVGGSVLYKAHQEQESNVEILRTSFNYLEESDVTLVEIDAFFQEKFNDTTVSRAEELLGKIPAAQKKLDPAREYAQRANEGLHASTKDKEAAEYALNSIAARETMFSVSKERLEEDIAAKKAMDAIDQAQGKITEANSLLTQAAKVVANTTTDNVNTSTQYTTAARELLAQAQEKVSEAQQSYPEADLSTLNEYVSKRIEAADAALASNAAILVQDKQVAEDHNTRYNEADTASVALAEKLPRSFNQPIVEAYQTSITALAQRYDAARSDVGRNDSYLREYLGIKTSS